MGEAIRQLNENQGTVIITRNGEAKTTIIDIREFEQMKETIAMLNSLLREKIVWPQSVSDRLKSFF